MMEIRSTEIKDLPLVMEIYDYARAFMRATGNTTQWIDGYPSEVLIRQEIEDGHSFVCIDEQGEILGTFCFILGDDPTYQQIYEGTWLNNEPYGVIHRLATNGKPSFPFDSSLLSLVEQENQNSVLNSITRFHRRIDTVDKLHIISLPNRKLLATT